MIWPRTYKININKEYKTHTFLKYLENEEIQSENIQFFFFIQTPLKFDIDPKEQHKLIYRRRRNYVVYKEMHSTSIKSKHRILICPFYIQIMGLHFKSFDVGKVYLWKLFTIGLNFGKKSCLFDIHIYVTLIFLFLVQCAIWLYT